MILTRYKLQVEPWMDCFVHYREVTLLWRPKMYCHYTCNRLVHQKVPCMQRCLLFRVSLIGELIIILQVCIISSTYCTTSIPIFHYNIIHLPTFTCSGGARYAEMDERPYCKRCFEKVPVELRRRLKKQAE